MTINLHKPDITELKPRISVVGVGGGGGNAVNNMINAGLQGVEFVVANTDAQALTVSKAERVIQLGAAVTEGLGAGSHPEVGRAAAEECLDEILDHLASSHMVFVTAGMGGGTGTGAAPVIARAAREKGLLTVGVVTKPFHFEGHRRMKTAEAGIEELQKSVDTLIVIPNQNLFRIANEKTTFADAFAMADQVLYSGVASITDLMVREGLINLDFADVRSVMHDMGKAMMGTGEASEQGRALAAAEAAIANPLLDETSMRGARGLLISITGGRDMTLFEVDEAVSRVREEVDPDANVIFGAILDEALEGVIRVSVVATGIDRVTAELAITDKNTTVVQSQSASVQIPTANTLHSPIAKKQETTVSAVETKNELPHSEPITEVMEALEEEMSTPAEESFRPQSQIFAKTSVTATEERPVQVSAHVMRVSSRPAVPQQPLTQPVATASEQKGASRVEAISEGTAREQRVVSSRIPEIDDFPPAIRQTMKGQTVSRLNDHAQGPRSLWQRLKQGFIHREDEEPAARLEPVGQNRRPTRPMPVPHGSRRPPAQDTAIYAPRRGPVPSEPQMRASQRLEETDEDKLEIPAFLRRQVN